MSVRKNADRAEYNTLLDNPRTRSNVHKLEEMRPGRNLLYPPIEWDPLHPPRRRPFTPVIYRPYDLFDMGSNRSDVSSLDIGEGEIPEDAKPEHSLVRTRKGEILYLNQEDEEEFRAEERQRRLYQRRMGSVGRAKRARRWKRSGGRRRRRDDNGRFIREVMGNMPRKFMRS